MVAALGSLEGYKLHAYFRQKATNLPFVVVPVRGVTASVEAYGRFRMLWTERWLSLASPLSFSDAEGYYCTGGLVP